MSTARVVSVREQMERIYGGMAPDAIPWNRTEPPELLVQLVESALIPPCDAVDLGCGLGHQARWLASQGFSVTGIDISPTAIELARRQSADGDLSCRFVVADLTQPFNQLDAAFDFAYDWEVLHHVCPRDRVVYVSNVHRMLRAGGRYLSVCFSDEDAAFGGVGKVRETPLGTTLYFSSQHELRGLFEPLFDVELLDVVEVPGTTVNHRAVRVLMRRRSGANRPVPGTPAADQE